MGNHFYGSYHWTLSPIEDRLALLEALKEFAVPGVNLFIESVSPSMALRWNFWRMRASYRTRLRPDMLSPEPSIFHIALTGSNLDQIKAVVARTGLTEQIAHLKGYEGDRGLFWFHGFCDEGDDTLCCSRHVDEETVCRLERRLGVRAEKRLGELKTDREQLDDLGRLLGAMDRQRERLVDADQGADGDP